MPLTVDMGPPGVRGGKKFSVPRASHSTFQVQHRGRHGGEPWPETLESGFCMGFSCSPQGKSDFSRDPAHLHDLIGAVRSQAEGASSGSLGVSSGAIRREELAVPWPYRFTMRACEIEPCSPWGTWHSFPKPAPVLALRSAAFSQIKGASFAPISTSSNAWVPEIFGMPRENVFFWGASRAQ